MEYYWPRDGRPLRSKVCLLQSRLLVAACLAFLFPSSVFATPIPTVRVLVERERSGIEIHGFDLVVNEADTGRRLGSRSGRSALPVRCSIGGKMELGLGQGPAIDRRVDAKGRVIATAASANSGSVRVSGPVHVQSLGGFLRVGQSQYRDDLYVYSFNGSCIVVNHVDLEKYVAGLLNSEMNAKWSLPTLMAQAVAARTYAIYQMQEASTVKYRALKPFDLEGSVRDQVYEGAHRERYRALQAVQQTRGQILTFEGKPIKAFYHSTCGGFTEAPEKVWGKAFPYMQAVKCGFCENSPRHTWTYTIPVRELEQKLRSQRSLKGNLLSLRVVERNSLGRASKVEVRGTQGTATVAAVKIRDLLGTLNLRSTNFTLGVTGGKATFVGNGSGHGVGMCQWGAKAMGEKGYSFSDILKHYYPRAEVARLY